jgi:hypothetical protein
MCDDLGFSRADVPAENFRSRHLVVDDRERRDSLDGLKRPVALRFGDNLFEDGSRHRDPVGQRPEKPELLALAE